MKVETLSRLCTSQTMITWQNFFFRQQVNEESLMKTLTLHMIAIEPAQCMLNRNK